MRNILCACVFIISLILSASAQHPFYYSIAEQRGLPSREVYQLAQDGFGYVWVGTDAGLFRYDGKRFKAYKSSKQNSRGVSNLSVAPDEKLWCQNFTGQIFTVQADSLYLEADQSGKQTNFPLFNISPKNELLFTSDTGIYVLKHGKPELIYNLLHHKLNGRPCIFSDVVTVDDKVFFCESTMLGYLHEGKLKLLRESNRPQRVAELLRQTFISIIGNRIMLLAHGERVNSIWEIRNDSLLWLRDLPQSLGRVFALHPDLNGKVWVGGSNGVLCLDEYLEDLFGGKLFFQGISISDVMLDREQNYWFSSLQEGIFVVPNLDVVVCTKQNAALADTRIKRLKATPGNLFIGYQNGVLGKMNFLGDKVQHITFSNSAAEIQEIACNADCSKLFIGQNNTWLLDVASLKEKQIPVDINLKSVTHLRKDTFFLGSVNEGYFALFNGSSFSRLRTLRMKRVRTSHYDKQNGTLFVGYSDGVFVYGNKGEHELKFKDAPIYATDIKADADGTVWISTVNKGVLKCSEQKIVQQINEEAGITNGFVRRLKLQRNQLWMLAETSVICFNINTRKSDFFTKHEGLPTHEISDIEITDGNVFLATPKGLVSFPATLNPQNLVSPNVRIESFCIHERDTTLTNAYTLLYSQNNIRIDFSTASFRSQGDFTFRYRMFGLDTNFIETTSDNSFARFASLPAGAYSFEVYAVNEDGVMSEKPATITIHILPPFWQRWWFYLLCAMLLASAVSLVFSLRIRQLNKRNTLEKKVIVSKLSALKAQMNPHFMFNALNSIQDLVLQQKTEKAQLYLGKFSELTRKVLEASGVEFISLQKETDMLRLYLELELLRFGTELSFSLSVADSVDPDETMIPSMVVQPFVENALKHGLLHKRGAKNLKVHFDGNNHKIECVIDDNGIGRDAAAEIKQRKPHRSFATQATAERLQLLKEFYGVEIDLRIEDKLDTNGNSTGTKVVLSFPALSHSVVLQG